MTARWHGAPVWTWAAGGTLLAAGVVYVYKRRKGVSATAATGDTSNQTPQGSYSGAPFPGAGNFLPPGSGDSTDTAAQQGLLDALTKAGTDLVDQVTHAGSTAVDAINSAATGATQTITQAASAALPSTPVAAIPPQPVASVPSAPVAPLSSPAAVAPSIFEGLGLAPAPVGMTALPIYASDNTVVGERFEGTSTFPTGSPDGKPWNVIDNPPPADQIRMTPNGPVTLAQWNILTPAQRGQ